MHEVPLWLTSLLEWWRSSDRLLLRKAEGSHTNKPIAKCPRFALMHYFQHICALASNPGKQWLKGILRGCLKTEPLKYWTCENQVKFSAAKETQ